MPSRPTKTGRSIVEKGENYGWSILEGRHCFDPPTGCNTDTLATPIWEYHHDIGRSVTGGYVYRGSETPQLYGKYIFRDFVNGQVSALSTENDMVMVEDLVDTNFHIVSFGVDADEEIYVVTIEDSLYRIKYTGPSTVEETPKASFALRVYPNPTSGQVSMAYELPNQGRVVLEIYNVLGVRVRRLVEGFVSEGRQSALWDGRDAVGRKLPSGSYFIRLHVDKRVSAVVPVNWYRR